MTKWATKNPPRKKGCYLVTIKDDFGTVVRQADRIEYPKGNWLWHIQLNGEIATAKAVAWRKCPEPYSGEQ